MAKKYIIKHRRKTTAEWATTAASLVPYDGEMVVEKCTDGTEKVKVGDGVNTFSGLNYTSEDKMDKFGNVSINQFDPGATITNYGAHLTFKSNSGKLSLEGKNNSEVSISSNGKINITSPTSGVDIKNLTSPTEDSDAANKEYVDTSLESKMDIFGTVETTLVSTNNTIICGNENKDTVIKPYSYQSSGTYAEKGIQVVTKDEANAEINTTEFKKGVITITDEYHQGSTATEKIANIKIDDGDVTITTSKTSTGDSATFKNSAGKITISGLEQPTNDSDAATKKYVDDHSGGGTQSNWNQNDSTSGSYINNRPFYQNGTVEKTLFTSNAMTFYQGSGSDPIYTGSEYINFDLIIGRQYKVTFDGTDYTCTAEDREGYIYMGSEDLDTDTSIPFMISVWHYINSYPDLGEEIELQVETKSTSATHSVIIKELTPNVNKLDPIYFDAPFVVNAVGTRAESYSQYTIYYTDANCVIPADPQPTSDNFSEGTYYKLIANVTFTEIRKQISLNRHVVLKAYNRTWDLSINNADDDDLYFYDRLDLDSTEITERLIQVRNSDDIATIDAIDEEKCVVAKPGDGGWSECHGSTFYAFGQNSIVEGNQNVAYQDNQHVQGKYNAFYLTNEQAEKCSIASQKEGTADANTPKLVQIVGNGTSPSQRSNAHTLDWDGNAWFKGDVYTGGSIGCKNRDSNSKKLATEEYVDTHSGKDANGVLNGNSLRIGTTTLTEQNLQALLALLGN